VRIDPRELLEPVGDRRNVKRVRRAQHVTQDPTDVHEADGEPGVGRPATHQVAAIELRRDVSR
jgi:hypothetical protein